MNSEIRKLIDMALSDGVLSSKEREIILRKAKSLGEDVDEGPMTLKQEVQMNEPEAAPQPKVQESVTAESVTIDDDDETMSYFAKLAAEQ